MPVVRRSLTPESAVALRDPHGVVHVMGGFVVLGRMIGPVCIPYHGDYRGSAPSWWRQDDCALLGPDAAVTCLWCASWKGDR